MHPDTLTTRAFYIAIKQWAGTVLIGCSLMTLQQPIVIPAGRGIDLLLWGLGVASILSISFFLVVPNMFLIRWVLRRTSDLSDRTRQFILCGVAALLTIAMSAVMLAGDTLSENYSDALASSLPWVIAATAAAWLARA